MSPGCVADSILSPPLVSPGVAAASEAIHAAWRRPKYFVNVYDNDRSDKNVQRVDLRHPGAIGPKRAGNVGKTSRSCRRATRLRLALILLLGESWSAPHTARRSPGSSRSGCCCLRCHRSRRRSRRATRATSCTRIRRMRPIIRDVRWRRRVSRRWRTCSRWRPRQTWFRLRATSQATRS